MATIIPSREFADARAYESFMGRWSRPLGRELVAFAGLQPAEHVLDLGCGTGSLSAALLADRSAVSVAGVDPSATFVQSARDRLPDPRARFHVGDAQHLPFADRTFDRALAMLVLNFVPDPFRAVGEMRRVTRPGGRVAACVWDYSDGMEMLRRFWDAAVALEPAVGPRHEGRMPLCRAGELTALWREARLEEIHEEPLTIETRFDSFDDFWQPFLAGVGPAGAYAASLPREARDALEAKLREELWSGRPDENRAFSARAWAVKGTVPAHSL